MPEIRQKDGEKRYDFEIQVIGGGSGGVALARQAAKGSYQVGLADQVEPSWQGTEWGIGGTCVNVGCIPKKLQHTSGLFGEARQDMRNAGWDLGNSDSDGNRQSAFKWDTLRQSVHAQIKSLNCEISTLMQDGGVVQHNAYATIVDNHTVSLREPSGKTKEITAKQIVLATGGRPNMNGFPGCKEYCISSDDIFNQKEAPGKTLVIGASQIALECGGFLHGLGQPVDIMVRSILLRGFDQECAQKIGEYMEGQGIKFIRPTYPNRVELLENGQRRAFYNCPETGNEIQGDYDTVLVAIGRHSSVVKTGLDKFDCKISDKGKVYTDRNCRLICDKLEDVYAVGDCVEGKPELTPTAIMDGKLLAGRLLNVHKENVCWTNVATTVQTPVEQSCIGLSEEECVETYGEDGFVVYAKTFRPLEWEFEGRNKDTMCQVKLLCEKDEQEKVVGFHQVGPNAGEVAQGYAVAMRLGATKYDFDSTVSIHPTSSENAVLIERPGKGENGPC